jgi:hypothetical protein
MANAVIPGEHQGQNRMPVLGKLIPQILIIKMRGFERGQGTVLLHFMAISRPKYLNRP